MQTNPPGIRADGEGQLGSVAELLLGRFDLGIGNVETTEAPKRIADHAPAGGELCPGREMLQLTATAGVCGVVRAAGLDPLRPRFENPIESGASESAGRAQVFQSDHIAGSGSGDENHPSIGQPTYAVATGGDAFDAHPLDHAADYWSASSRACRSQTPPIAGSPLVTTWRRVWRSSASASAAAIARS